MEYCIVALISYSSDNEGLYTYNKDGKFVKDSTTWADLKLEYYEFEENDVIYNKAYQSIAIFDKYDNDDHTKLKLKVAIQGKNLIYNTYFNLSDFDKYIVRPATTEEVYILRNALANE